MEIAPSLSCFECQWDHSFCLRCSHSHSGRNNEVPGHIIHAKGLRVGFPQGFTPCLPAAAEFTANVSSPPLGVAENMRGTQKKWHARAASSFSVRIRLQHGCVRLARRLQTKHTTRDYCAHPYTTGRVFWINNSAGSCDEKFAFPRFDCALQQHDYHYARQAKLFFLYRSLLLLNVISCLNGETPSRRFPAWTKIFRQNEEREKYNSFFSPSPLAGSFLLVVLLVLLAGKTTGTSPREANGVGNLFAPPVAR